MQPMASRAGKTYFVTGGASGLGLAAGKLLISHGANVVLADKAVEQGQKVARDLGNRCAFVEVDVTERDSVSRAIASAVQQFGSLHGVINCAGVASAITTIDKNLEPHKSEAWDTVCKINMYGTFYTAAAGAAAMAKLPADEDGQRGVIVNIASVAALEGQKGQVAYAASKGAVVAMSLPMARDLSRYGIRVVCIAPGIIDTPMLRSMPAKVQENLLSSVAGPKRFGLAEEFAALVAHVIDNGYLNGEVIRFDGGIRMANL